MLVKYFAKQDDNWRLAARVRRAVEFRAANLIEDTSGLGRFDIILCRNVLCDLDGPTRSAVLERLSRQLTPHGVLLLGANESAVGASDTLQPVPGRTGYYVKAAPQRAAA
jgi:chemotaxis protein methyltransferase CheR